MLLSVCLCLALCRVAGAEQCLVASDGTRTQGSLASVGGGKLSWQTAGGTKELPLSDVVAVEFGQTRGGAVSSQRGRHVVIAEDGSRFGGQDVTIKDGKLSASTAFGGKVSVPMQAVVRVFRPASHESAADIERRVNSLGLKRGDQDTVVVGTAATELVPVSGIVLGLSETQLMLNYDGAETPMPGETVKAIQTAQVKAPAGNQDAVVCTLECADGSAIGVSALKAKGAGLQVRSPSLGPVTVSVENASALRFRNEQVMPIGELAPRVKQTPFFDESFALQRDRAVHGGPLSLSGRTYERGLGVHARCELDYALEGKYRGFSALVGIDDSVRAGTARFSVRVDGKPAVTDLALDRSKPPQTVQVDLKGADSMTILVDFENNTFGGGARVDLCDAVLKK